LGPPIADLDKTMIHEGLEITRVLSQKFAGEFKGGALARAKARWAYFMIYEAGRDFGGETTCRLGGSCQ
jgi:hypothetical protein